MACQPLGTGQMMKCCHTALPCGLKIKEPTSRRARVGRGGQGPPNHLPTPGSSDLSPGPSASSPFQLGTSGVTTALTEQPQPPSSVAFCAEDPGTVHGVEFQASNTPRSSQHRTSAVVQYVTPNSYLVLKTPLLFPAQQMFQYPQW